MNDRELERRLRAWYDDAVPEGETAPVELREGLVAIPTSAPVPLRALRGRRGFPILAAAALLLAGGAFAAGSALVRLTTVPPPTPSDAALLSPAPSGPDGSPPASTLEPTVAPIPPARAGGLIAFTRSVERAAPQCFRYAPVCPVSRVWVAGVDGSNPHELVSDGLTSQQLMGWTPDGSRLLIADEGGLALADPAGGQPQHVDTGCAPPSPETPDVCQRDSQVAFSADGRHIVFLRESTNADGYWGPSVIATLDLATGVVAELTSTSDGLEQPAWSPGWSPDGSQIVFSRYGTDDDGGPVAPVLSAIFVVDADGSNLRQVSPPTIAAFDARWSPDGSRIVFVSPAGGGDGAFGDIYTIRPDGSNLRQVTSGTLGASPSWTPDGQILFSRRAGAEAAPSEPGWWTMDADGGGLALLVPRSAVDLAPDQLAWSRPALQPLGGPGLASTTWTPVPPVAVGPAAPTPAPTPVPELGPGFAWTGESSLAEDGLGGSTATLLADGRVLVTWGCSTAAELYDPSTGTFSPTGSMTAVRAAGTVTLLADGRVLFAGGYDCGRGGEDGIWSSAEVYDPATGSFLATGSMRSPREFHTATRLADGRVLVAGGLTGEEPAAAGAVVLASVRTVDVAQILDTAELYDPATGTFSLTGRMQRSHMHHTATGLQDGRVLILGSSGGESSPDSRAAELYDPSTGTFERTGSLSSVRGNHTATLLADGRVFVAGGGGGPNNTVYRSAELYDPRSGTFSATSPMADRRESHTATLLPDGRVLVAGGYWRNGDRWRVLAETELFDPATGTFTPGGLMGTPRSDHTATRLLDGRVLINGGWDLDYTVPVTTGVLFQP